MGKFITLREEFESETGAHPFADQQYIEWLEKLVERQSQVKNCSIPNVGKRIYLTFADYNCDSTYNTLEKANQRVKQIKDQNPDMEGVYIISREVE